RTLISIAEARARVAASIVPLPAEEIDVARALDRVLAEDVSAAGDVPAFANSAMDGFAIQAGAGNRRLRIVGESRAGLPAPVALADGEAIRISTGAALPGGADGVLELEEAEEAEGWITTQVDTAPGRNVRHPGDDLRAGETVLTTGTRLGPAELGVAIGAARSRVRCARSPRLAVVATGDELVPAGEPLGPGQIHDSNAVTLAALARRAGAQEAPGPASREVADTPKATEEALASALAGADVVVVSGGVSVGPHDHVKDALGALGVKEAFWGVALKPGRPTWFGTRDGKLVFGLPGNPVSAMVTFLLFVRPALAGLQGASFDEGRYEARLTTAVARNPRRDQAIRVRVDVKDAGVLATPTGPQASHVLSSMLDASGLAIVEAGDGEMASGECVVVEPISRP
ncbi:MAG: molybdopterin molybdotransferase, partial [Solirubrobacteraceae bacterium]|nr:molybdopterin molybdotransferase [Solirubrobacteraceae bacterium]